MRTMIVAKDSKEVARRMRACTNSGEWEKPVCFEAEEPALEYVQNHRIEMAILETGPESLDGLGLCRRLRHKLPQLVPIFLSNCPDFAMSAFQVGAADYLLRPVKLERLDRALDRARRLSEQEPERIRIRTFGHFDVFVEGSPVRFSRQKSKEILAYLVDRWGGVATNEQILAALWEDRAGESGAKAGFQTAFKALRADLERVGAAGILKSSRGQKWLDVKQMSCDYFQLMEGVPAALEAFPGQYMAEYSWAETTNANCNNLKQQYKLKQREKSRKTG